MTSPAEGRTRRGARRTAEEVLRSLLSMFESKHRAQRGPARYSELRIIDAAFAVAFVAHWPDGWTTPAVIALALILFALPVDTLMAKVPASEAMEAVQAFFGAFGAKATGNAIAALSDAHAAVTTETPEAQPHEDPEAEP